MENRVKAEMAAAAPISTWIPEDDLLLKNAVEAGASLEALAKGAVQFSRRFTFQELRDRWHSLLYDPDISAQASSHMVELELSASNLSSKFNRSDNSKESKEVPAKRKVGSIRRQYYAMRKRIRSEFFNTADLGFLSESNLLDCGGNGGDLQEHVTLDNGPSVGNCMLGDCISNHFQVQETDFDILHHTFPQTMRDFDADNAVDNTGEAFHTGCSDSLEDNHRNRIGTNDSLFEFPENVSSLSVKEMLRNEGRESFQQNNAHKDITRTLEDNLVEFGRCSGVEEMGPSQPLPLQPLPDRKLFETDDSKTKPSSNFNSMNDNLQNICSGFKRRQHFNSLDSDGNTAFHTMEFSSPLPTMPLWRTMEDISAPAMPVNMNLGDKSHGAEEISTIPGYDDGKNKSSSGYDVVHPGPMLRDRHNGDGFINSSAISDGEFADLSDSIFNFSNEDDNIFMDVDGKDTTDKSSYDSFNTLLLSSPNNIQKDDVPNVETKALMVSNTCLATPSDACPAEPEVITTPFHAVHGDQQIVCHPEVNLPSTSVLNSKSLEYNDGNTYCTLNTEDPEIPCNDDIFLLIHPATSFTSSATPPITVDAIDLPSSTAIERDSERGLSLRNKGEDRAPSFMLSNMVGLNMLPETGPDHELVACAGKSELPDTNCLTVVPRQANKALANPSQCRTTHATPNSATDGKLKEDVIKVELGMIDAPAILREMTSHAEAGSVKMTLPEFVVNPSTSDQEESESENDVPYFSDIEAMILEMDLGPYEQDSYISRQVSRYQCEDSKRTIIRLEQCARSSLQRAMASQGALAILYGHRLKHHIRKTEVILGRSTDDVEVDIDLGKEGRANKISRRQVELLERSFCAGTVVFSGDLWRQMCESWFDRYMVCQPWQS
uniref:FHA domain-containing protein n=1 Tax=Davidia involucrata TaxID=16924 RepID=A0A5B7AE40_DAVIN